MFLSVGLPILFGAAAGLLTVTVFIFLLFHPKKTVKIGPLQLQSVIYRAWPQIQSKILDATANTDLFSKTEIKEMISNVDLSEEAIPLIDQRLDAFFSQVTKEVPMAAMFLQGPLIDTLKGQARDQFIQVIPELQTKAADHMSTAFDPKILIQDKLKAIDINTVESLLQKELQPHLLEIRGLSIAIGGSVGLLHAILLMITN
jgi:uncharacterized membrane protein YheB (UPF0754 family)